MQFNGLSDRIYELPVNAISNHMQSGYLLFSQIIGLFFTPGNRRK